MSEQLATLSAMQFFFVVGMPKSGTTWLQNILDKHREVICRGETNIKKRWQLPLENCVETYNNMVAASGFDKVYFNEKHLDYLFLSGVLLMMQEWLHNRSQDPIRLIGERTPNFMSDRMDTWNKYFPECKFVHIIRDPRDAAVSGWLFWSRRKKKVAASRFNNIEDFFRYYISQWIQQIEKARQLSLEFEGRYIECRYEDLIAEPNSTLTTLLEFLGVDADVDIVERCLVDASFETVSGRKRGEEDFTGNKLRKGVVGDWVNHIDRNHVSELYDSTLARFGY
ncbi:MAG: hypothetical protein DHS20C01_12180 [marine bacterium B5-7]|nr:MAG: hypothetical protein DHS20C01_12180 [marine bacterium B5-7]